jgi:O-methyltransferase involved in polyketide biosynthesis
MYSSVAFDPNKPTLFTVEGLIYYLPKEAVQGLFAAMVKVAAPGSRVAFDFLHLEVRREKRRIEGGKRRRAQAHSVDVKDQV